jgi:hypothetical protein
MTSVFPRRSSRFAPLDVRPRRHAGLDAGYKRVAAAHPFAIEAFNSLMWTLEHAAHREGEPIEAFPGREMRLVKTARTSRIPALRVL